jgi:hypothetical protein
VPKKVLSACFLKTFGFQPRYPCSVVHCERKCAKLNRSREKRPQVSGTVTACRCSVKTTCTEHSIVIRRSPGPVPCGFKCTHIVVFQIIRKLSKRCSGLSFGRRPEEALGRHMYRAVEAMSGHTIWQKSSNSAAVKPVTVWKIYGVACTVAK